MNKCELVEYLLSIVPNGEAKIYWQNKKVLKIRFTIGEKVNEITLEDIKTAIQKS